LFQQKPTLFGWSVVDLRSSSLSRPDLHANASSSEARAGSGLRLGTLTAKGRPGELNVPHVTTPNIGADKPGRDERGQGGSGLPIVSRALDPRREALIPPDGRNLVGMPARSCAPQRRTSRSRKSEIREAIQRCLCRFRCPAPTRKIFCFRFSDPSHREVRIAIVTTRETGMRWTLGGARDCDVRTNGAEADVRSRVVLASRR